MPPVAIKPKAERRGLFIVLCRRAINNSWATRGEAAASLQCDLMDLLLDLAHHALSCKTCPSPDVVHPSPEAILQLAHAISPCRAVPRPAVSFSVIRGTSTSSSKGTPACSVDWPKPRFPASRPGWAPFASVVCGRFHRSLWQRPE